MGKKAVFVSFVRFGFWNTVVSTVVAVAAVTVLKREHDAGVCDNFAKFLKTAFLHNTSGRLLLYFHDTQSNDARFMQKLSKHANVKRKVCIWKTMLCVTNE